MTATMSGVNPIDSSERRAKPSAEEEAAAELVRMAREQGLSLTGPDGLLKQSTKNVLETALNEEMTEHLGHEKHQATADRSSANVRNGTRSKTVLTEAAGQVEIDVPRDREGSFEPQIVKKRQRRLGGVDEIVQHVSSGLAAAQVLPALAGAILGVPAGLALIAAVDPDTPTNPPLWQLLAVVPGTVLVVAALTTIPARIGARRSVADILQAEHA